MREREGLFAVVAAAGVISALLFAGLNPREPDLPAYQYGERASADYQSGGASCEPRALAAIRDNGKAAVERKRCAEAAEEHRLKREDLVQQARAADAAQAQTWLNFYLARMALWGTIGGFLTLIAASLAAFYARDAAKASRGSLQAFISAEDAHLVLDLVLGVFGSTTTADGVTTTHYTFHATLTNVGRAAARLQQLIISSVEGSIARPLAETLKVDGSTQLSEKLWINPDIGKAAVTLFYATSLHPVTKLTFFVEMEVSYPGHSATAYVANTRIGRPREK
jgi:hypothetical protein